MARMGFTLTIAGTLMVKIGRNDLCTCGSRKKYKKCCLDKKPHEQSVMVASPERLHGFHYDKERREFTGLTLDDRLIKPVVIYSQTHYKNDSGKEKVIARIQDKIIPNEAELMKFVEEVLKENPKVVDDVKNGKERAIGSLVGALMKKTQGRANPQLANQLLKKRIGV